MPHPGRHHHTDVSIDVGVPSGIPERLTQHWGLLGAAFREGLGVGGRLAEACTREGGWVATSRPPRCHYFPTPMSNVLTGNRQAPTNSPGPAVTRELNHGCTPTGMECGESITDVWAALGDWSEF